MRDFSLLVVLTLILMGIGGCGNIAQLENENAELKASADSLRQNNFACIKQNTVLAVKIDSLQREINEQKEKATKLHVQRAEEDSTQERMRSRQAPIETPPRTSEINYLTPVQANQSFQSLYQNALYEFKMKNYSQSLVQFTELAKTLPVTDLTDNCEYWIGECYYALGQYPDAVTRFNTVLKYIGSDKSDDALLMLGNCHLKLGQPENAKEEFKKLLEQFPESEYAPRVKEKLSAIK